MRKKSVVILAALFLFVNLSACAGKDTMNQYKAAVNNTNNINNASEAIDFNIKLDIAQSNLTQKMKNQLEAYNDIKGSATTYFDREKNIIKLKGHIDIKNIGFDFEISENKKITTILFPLFPKYLVLDRNVNSDGFNGLYFDSKRISSDSLNKKITKENIKKLNNTIITTPEGELKVNNYYITVTGEMIMEKLTSVIEYIISSRELKDFITEAAINANIKGINNNNKKDEVLNTLIGKLNRNIKNAEISKPTYSVSCDKDFLIRQVNETFDVKYSIDSENILKMSIVLTKRLWNIGKTNIDMVDINASNSFTIKEAGENVPDFYKNILKNSKR